MTPEEFARRTIDAARNAEQAAWNAQGWDVNEWRIAEANARIGELREAAEKDDLSDALTAELGNLAENITQTWTIAVRAMAERWGNASAESLATTSDPRLQRAADFMAGATAADADE